MVAWYFLSPTVWIFLKRVISISFVLFISNKKVEWANDNLMFLMVHFEILAWVLCDTLNNSRFLHFWILSMCNSELQKALIYLCTKRKMTRNQLVQSGMKTSPWSMVVLFCSKVSSALRQSLSYSWKSSLNPSFGPIFTLGPAPGRKVRLAKSARFRELKYSNKIS